MADETQIRQGRNVFVDADADAQLPDALVSIRLRAVSVATSAKPLNHIRYLFLHRPVGTEFLDGMSCKRPKS